MKYGPFGPFTGKLGGLVTYIRKGETVSRMVPHVIKRPGTLGQLASRKQFSMAQKFVAPVRDFVSYSFHPLTKNTTRIPQNQATSLFRKHAIMGEYPDFWIDYSKVIMSKGNLPAPLNANVLREGDLLTFTWTVDPNWDYLLNSDQVMMMAYLPDTLNAAFIVGGIQRTAGMATLQFDPELRTDAWVKRDTRVETYIAFISNDRQQVSDSIYTSQIIL